MTRTDLTICYYTSNREEERFERNIQRHLLEVSGGIPIISVSQKPIDFGMNICVGDVGVSSQNAFRQLQIGAKAATTRFVCPGEADLVHPPEFFDFIPRRDDRAYVAFPFWLLFYQKGKAKLYVRKPRSSECAIIVNRLALIKGIDTILEGQDIWGPMEAKHLPYLLHVMKKEPFVLPNPIVAFKTDRNMHRRAPHDVNSKTRTIPYWGGAHDMIRRFTE